MTDTEIKTMLRLIDKFGKTFPTVDLATEALRRVIYIEKPKEA